MKVKQFMAAVLVVFGLLVAVNLSTTAQAFDPIDCNLLRGGAGSAEDIETCEGLTKSEKLDASKGATGVWSVVQNVLWILAGIAVIMIIVGGLRYTLSQGDEQAVSSAKNTILYAVVGLVVALLASGIVLLVKEYFLR